MAKDICENCGAPLDPSYTFCLNCGAKVVEKPALQDEYRQKQEAAFQTIPVQPQSSNAEGHPIAVDGFCRECGSKVRAGWLYCMQCGTVLIPINSGFAIPGNTSTLTIKNYPAAIDTGIEAGADSSFDDGSGTYGEFDDDVTSVYEDDPDDVTMVYGDYQESYTLVRMSSGERYELSLPTTVGRGSKAEVRVSGNPYIGRIHVEVFERDGAVFIVDKHTANHTYVNGKMIEPEAATKIEDGDSISLAKEEFRFEVDTK